MTGSNKYAIRQPQSRKGNRISHAPKEERIPPTPETRLKLRPDPLIDCDEELHGYAEEIARVHSALTGIVAARAMKYQEGRGKSHGSPEDWLSRKGNEHKRRAYNEWRRRLPQMFVYPNAIMQVICDLAQPWDMDRKYCQDPNTVGGWVISALKLYGKLR